MTDQNTHSPSPKPVYLRFGDWYVLKEGNSHIRAFAEIDGKTIVDYGHKEEVIDRPFDDYKVQVSQWADIVE